MSPARLVRDPPSAGIALAGVLVLEDGAYVVRRDGTLEPVLAGGWPRPGLAHATASKARASGRPEPIAGPLVGRERATRAAREIEGRPK